MADVLLFHHAHGLTPGVVALADELRAAGHTVTVPDLYEGTTFEHLEEGVAHARDLGFDTVLERGAAAAEGLPEALAIVGLSLGVMPGQMVAQTRPGVTAAVLMGSCVAPGEFGTAWPDTVPVQVHGMDADPIFVGEGDIDAARELVAGAKDGELFLYPGDGHLFVDPGLASYDEAAARLFTERVLVFLDGR